MLTNLLKYFMKKSKTEIFIIIYLYKSSISRIILFFNDEFFGQFGDFSIVIKNIKALIIFELQAIGTKRIIKYYSSINYRRSFLPITFLI